MHEIGFTKILAYYPFPHINESAVYYYYGGSTEINLFARMWYNEQFGHSLMYHCINENNLNQNFIGAEIMQSSCMQVCGIKIQCKSSILVTLGPKRTKHVKVVRMLLV